MAEPVSVIVRTYNRAAYLGEAIDSALAQSAAPAEVVVVDDGSTDETPALLARYAGRVTAVARAHTGNLAALANAGVAAARGALLAFLDSDDLWLPDKLARQLRLLEDRRYGFAYGNFVLRDAEGRTGGPALAPGQVATGWILRAVVHDMGVHLSTAVVRRGAFEAAGGFDERSAVVEDFRFFVALARVAEGVCDPEPVAVVRRHAGQTSTGWGLDAFTGAAGALEDLLRGRDLAPEVRREAHRSIARYQTHVARVLVEQGRAREARPHLWQALRHDPLHRPLWRWMVRAR